MSNTNVPEEKTLKLPYIVRLASIFIVIVLMFVTLYYLSVVFVPLLFSIIFAVMLFPFATKFEKWGLGKALAALLAVLITTLILGLLVYLIIGELSTFFQQTPALSARMTEIVESIKEFIAEKFDIKRSIVAERVQAGVNNFEDYSERMLAGALSQLPTFLINLFLIPIYIFFLLYYRHFFLEFFYKVFHAEERTDIDQTVDEIGVIIKGYVFGLFLDVIIIGAANTIALYFIGISYSVVLGFGLALFCIIPYIGMIAGSIMVLIVALITTTTAWQPVTAVGVLWVIHMIDSNIVAPYVIGSRVNINPLVSIFILFIFGELWGLPGLFLAFPLAAILKVIFDRVNGLKPFGFLLGEPQKYHLRKFSLFYVKRKQQIEERKNQTPMSDVLPGETGQDPFPGEKKKIDD